MRRLVVELPLRELPGTEQAGSHFEMIESAEILYFLKWDNEEFAVIFKIRLRDGSSDSWNAMQTLHGDGLEMRLLEEGEGDSYTYFVKGKVETLHPGFGHHISDGYVTTPFEVRNGNLRLTVIGDTAQARNFLRDAERMGVHYRVISLTEAVFSSSSPLSCLTERQREVLTTAYELGYYDRPRRISSKKLAERLGLSSSTLVAHRLKAERRILAAVLENK